MKNKIYSWLSIIALAAGLLVAVYVFLDIYLLSRRIPAGACPIDSNRPLMYAALALCVSSFLFSILEKRSKKH